MSVCFWIFFSVTFSVREEGSEGEGEGEKRKRRRWVKERERERKQEKKERKKGRINENKINVRAIGKKNIYDI